MLQAWWSRLPAVAKPQGMSAYVKIIMRLKTTEHLRSWTSTRIACVISHQHCSVGAVWFETHTPTDVACIQDPRHGKPTVVWDVLLRKQNFWTCITPVQRKNDGSSLTRGSYHATLEACHLLHLLSTRICLPNNSLNQSRLSVKAQVYILKWAETLHTALTVTATNTVISAFTSIVTRVVK